MKWICLVALVVPLTARADDPVQRYSAAYVALARQAADGLQKVAALVDPKDCGSVDKALPVATKALKEHEKLLQDYEDAKKATTPEQRKAGTRAAMTTLMPEFQQSRDSERAAGQRLKDFEKSCPKQAEQAQAQLKPLIQKVPND
jgi:hypothetical protein